MDPENMVEPWKSFWGAVVQLTYFALKRSFETLVDHGTGFFLTFPGLLYHPRLYHDTWREVAIGAICCRLQGKKTFW